MRCGDISNFDKNTAKQTGGLAGFISDIFKRASDICIHRDLCFQRRSILFLGERNVF